MNVHCCCHRPCPQNRNRSPRALFTCYACTLLPPPPSSPIRSRSMTRTFSFLPWRSSVIPLDSDTFGSCSHLHKSPGGAAGHDLESRALTHCCRPKIQSKQTTRPRRRLIRAHRANSWLADYDARLVQGQNPAAAVGISFLLGGLREITRPDVMIVKAFHSQPKKNR